MSERTSWRCAALLRVYQAFRWWGVGTASFEGRRHAQSLSSVPVVGCRNNTHAGVRSRSESIKRSGGGVSELWPAAGPRPRRVYQAFRWWGVGTTAAALSINSLSLSSVPVVGCRNLARVGRAGHKESIKRSGGGVSEQIEVTPTAQVRVYQAFRWWGVGTLKSDSRSLRSSLSSVPVVGCRNRSMK